MDLDAADMDFCQYAQDLILQAQMSQQEAPEDPPISVPVFELLLGAQPRPRIAASSSSSSTSKTQITLANLFDYTLDRAVGQGLEFYWPGSIKNLEDDLLAHERAASAEAAPYSTTPLQV